MHSTELCTLWCTLQEEKYGDQCVEAMQETPFPVNITNPVAPNGVPLGPGVSPNGDIGTAPNGTPLGPGVSPNGSPVTPPGVAPNGVPLGPGVSPNGDTGTAHNGTPLGPGVSPNGSPICPYENNIASLLLCQLFESIEKEKGNPSPGGSEYDGNTFNQSSCPYISQQEGTLICDLWCELINLQLGLTCMTPIDVSNLAPNGVPLGPGVSPNGDTGTAPNGTPLGPGVSPNGSPVTQPGVAPNGVPLGPGVSPNGDTGT